MGNPMTQTAIVTEAYKVGAEKLGTKVCQVTHQDQGTDHKILGAHQCVGSHPTLKPGQAYHHHGADIANPQPSDIEVEAVLGKKIYDPKPDPRSKEEMVLKANQQDNELAELKNTIARQGELLNAFLSGAQQAPKSIEPSPAPPDIEEKSLGDMSMSELRAIASPHNIKTARMSKEKLIEAIKYARG